MSLDLKIRVEVLRKGDRHTLGFIGSGKNGVMCDLGGGVHKVQVSALGNIDKKYCSYATVRFFRNKRPIGSYSCELCIEGRRSDVFECDSLKVRFYVPVSTLDDDDDDDEIDYESEGESGPSEEEEGGVDDYLWDEMKQRWCENGSLAIGSKRKHPYYKHRCNTHGLYIAEADSTSSDTEHDDYVKKQKLSL